MRRTLITIGTLLVAVLLVLGACAPAPALPEFEVISLDIKPMEAEAGETVSITAVVENIGGSEGTYAVILTVDGVTVEAKETALITPGSSAVVTFSLVKDAPGTYEISIGELSSSLVVGEKLVAKKVELKYDDDEPESFTSQGPGWGYSVHFSPPATPFTISKVKVMAGLYGTEYADKKASLEIWSQDFDVLYSHEMPVTEFSEEGGWITVETNITVDGDFRVVFFTNSGQEEGGISIGYDLSGTNEGSEVARADGRIVDWIEQWEPTRPRETTNWMIRVVGTPAEEGTPVTSPLTQTSEGGAEFQEAIRLLDTPEKVSRWVGQNMKYKSEDINEYAPAWVIFERGYDDCDGFATIQSYFLKANGYDAWNIGIAIETPYGHNVCGYKDNDKWFVLDTNGIMRGPFESLEQLADEVGNLYKIPRGSSIYLIDPFDIVSTTPFPKYQVYRE